MCLAVPGRVVERTETSPAAFSGKVDFGGVLREVNLSLVPEAAVGDYVLVHVGVALTRIDAAEAERVFRYLQEIDDLEIRG
jgi:hydrogenase expression/formation protein HypC